jgi:hypothetical protein
LRDDQGFGKDGAVSARSFRAIESLVGTAEKELHRRGRSQGVDGNGADTDRNRERACLSGEWAGADCVTDLLGTMEKRIPIEGLLPQAGKAVVLAAVEEDEELLSTIAAHQVARPDATGQATGHLTKDFIADEMAMGVIDLLEMIYIA